MKQLSILVWAVIGAALFAGLYGIIAIIVWAVAVQLLAMFKPKWLEKIYETLF